MIEKATEQEILPYIAHVNDQTVDCYDNEEIAARCDEIAQDLRDAVEPLIGTVMPLGEEHKELMQLLGDLEEELFRYHGDMALVFQNNKYRKLIEDSREVLGIEHDDRHPDDRPTPLSVIEHESDPVEEGSGVPGRNA